MSTLIFILLFRLFVSPPAPSAQFILELTPQQYPLCVTALQREGIDFRISPIHTSTPYFRLSSLDGDIIRDHLRILAKKQIITRWQADRPVDFRNTPDDPMFPNQWGMMRIGMPEAWNVTTGGVTVAGDTIVVAILDSGFDVEHEDLKQNLWTNTDEIPGDGIDNDLNGYTDDYRGLNVGTDNDVHTKDIHGTSVAGIIGARGDNAKGICGVNWNVKLLLISNIHKESDIIEGYAYVKALREKYTSSNGTHGAFIVATNLSAGIDNALPADHQLWCDQYESLGAAGILGICATTNANSDVDINGDMPTTCPSAYLVAVTNTGIDDEKLLFAGFGPLHTDLGAPGTPSLSTALSNGYEDFEGTSAAAPHVAGAVALLYASACADVLELASSDPAGLARQMKNLVLENTDKLPGLAEITLSGGRLNVARSVGALAEVCDHTGGKLEILQVTPNPVTDETRIDYNIPDLNAIELLLYDSAGRLLLQADPEIIIPGNQSYTLNAKNLVPGVYYVTLRHQGKVVSTSILVQ